VIKVDLGCGRNKLQGYFGIDRFVGGDVRADLLRLPLLSGSVEDLYCSHVLEHLPKACVVPALKEIARVLHPDGFADIRVPSLEWCVTRWLEMGSSDWWLDIIFGNQEHEGEFHKTGFNIPIMANYLSKSRLTCIQFDRPWTHNQETLAFLCVRQKNDSHSHS